MFSKGIMSLLNQFIPVGLAAKGLEKIDPRMKSFISAAAGFGYGTNEVIDFLRSKTHTKEQKENRRNLEERTAQGTARPDESANLERLNQDEVTGNALQGAAALGAGALGGLGAASLAGKGARAAQASPQLQQAAQQTAQAAAPLAQPPPAATKQAQAAPGMAAQAAGGVKSAPGRMAQAGQAQNPFDVFLRKNPELGRFIEKKVNEGIDPITAAKRAKAVKKFMHPIQKVENEVGQKFEDVVAQVFGGGQQQQQAPSQQKSFLSGLVNEARGMI